MGVHRNKELDWLKGATLEQRFARLLASRSAPRRKPILASNYVDGRMEERDLLDVAMLGNRYDKLL